MLNARVAFSGVFLRIIAGYNLGLMEWERSPEVDKLKFGAAEHRYFAGAC